MATIPAAVPEAACPTDAPVFALQGVPWDVYQALRDMPENYHVHMTFKNGNLELIRPSFWHELASVRLATIVRAVTMDLNQPCLDAGSTTLQRKGKGPQGGYGKEPDSCFCLANEPRMRHKREFDLAVDPPPDLAIEVEVNHRSESTLKIYAKIGVPEVWRYNGRKLWIGRLRENGTYARCGASPALPMLTPEVILQWLSRVDDLGQTEWFRQLCEWVRTKLTPKYGARKK